jgi:hypothetical protein
VITVFATPKPMVGPVAIAQRNAIGSWARLHPAVEVFLIGADEGVAQAARELGVGHVPDVSLSDSGTPLLDSMFAAARERARHDLLLYVNADIVLLSDLRDAAVALAPRFPSFLLVGESRDVPLDRALDFGDGWERELRDLVVRGRRRGAGALDYFLFTRDLFAEVPPFAAGRVGFDNWLVWRARADGAAVVDGSRVVRALHQSHEYGHVAGGRAATRQTGAEGARNLALAGGKDRLYTRYDATHLLTSRGLRPNLLRVGRLKERTRKAVYQARGRTPWPPGERQG